MYTRSPSAVEVYHLLVLCCLVVTPLSDNEQCFLAPQDQCTQWQVSRLSQYCSETSQSPDWCGAEGWARCHTQQFHHQQPPLPITQLGAASRQQRKLQALKPLPVSPSSINRYFLKQQNLFVSETIQMEIYMFQTFNKSNHVERSSSLYRTICKFIQSRCCFLRRTDPRHFDLRKPMLAFCSQPSEKSDTE